MTFRTVTGKEIVVLVDAVAVVVGVALSFRTTRNTPRIRPAATTAATTAMATLRRIHVVWRAGDAV
jgi:hypothetical protein